METVGVDDLVYVPVADAEAFLAGRVVSDYRGGTPGVDVQVETANGSLGEILHVPRSDLRLRFVREDGVTSQDNTSLVHLNDATILQNLRLRHGMNHIYTYTASVLLAVNPYKDISGLYGEEQCARYKGKHIGALPPHPYAIADAAYRALVRENKNQGLLISGESGAGKTETAKIVMQFLAFASGGTQTAADSIQARVLRAQPILESFGNAVTMRNSNSSRFGKYMRVFFDKLGALTDADIVTYLLETSRVVVHGERERTYHCFYEMLAGIDDAKLQEFGLERNRRYRLLCGATGEFLPGFEARDRVNFQRLCDALKTVGISDRDLDNILRVLAACIHLGDLDKDEASPVGGDDDDAKAVEVDDDSAEKAARLLGMDVDELRARLTRKKVKVPGRNSFHETPRTYSQFKHALQSFIKALYKRVFERLVQRINDSFREIRPAGAGDRSEDTCRHIGILDIYGFERLQRNSFEQLCINLANERLQQYFVENVLRAEQELYAREALPWIGLPLPDATPVFNAIAQVFKTLDEYSQNLTQGVGKGDAAERDRSFCQKVVEEAAKDPERKEVLRQLKMSGGKKTAGAGPSVTDGFTIKHYAGQVEYTTKGWLDKNNDRLLVECETLICESTDEMVKSLGEDDQGKGTTLFRSISKKYCKDLEALLETLSTCNLHYIRCFKPNGEQKADSFHGQLVLDQIVQCGTIELVKIMHDGYPNRCPFEEITTRFRDLLPEDFQRYGMRTFIEALMLAYDVPKEEWALGMSRLFLKAGQLRALESMREEGARPSPEKLAQIVRGIIRKRWVRAGHAVRLCNFLPRFLEQILQRRAARVLYIAALAKARLGPRAAAARRRILDRHLARRRKLVAAFQTVRLARALWADTLKRREAERQREEERVRAEEERLRTEAERAEAERVRLEEEAKRGEELRLERERESLAEEKRRIEEERLRNEEEMRRRQEAEREELEEQKRQIAEERRLLDERRAAILAAPSPQHVKPQGGGKDVSSLPCPSDDVIAQASTDMGEDDDLRLGESVSNAGTSVGMQSALNAEKLSRSEKEELQERMEKMEAEMKRKHEEILQQMSALVALNDDLKQKLHQKQSLGGPQMLGGGSDGGDRSTQSPSRRNRHDASPISVSPKTPLSSARRAQAGQSASRSGHRMSLISLEQSDSNNSNRNSTASKGKRRSIVQEALRQDSRGERQYSLGDAAPGHKDLSAQRFWWAEQRNFLLEDLYGMGSPPPGRAHARAGTSGRPQAPTPTRVEVRTNLSTMLESAEETPTHRGTSCQPSGTDEAGRPGDHEETKIRKPAVFVSSHRNSLTGGSR